VAKRAGAGVETGLLLLLVQAEDTRRKEARADALRVEGGRVLLDRYLNPPFPANLQLEADFQGKNLISSRDITLFSA
jgi:hypothetical protein